MIGFSIELGKVICITDPEIAKARDRDMIAARKLPGYQPPPPPQPRLGTGLWNADAPGGGLLGIQSEIEVDGRRGLFDDVLGVRFGVMARDPALLAGLSGTDRAALERWNAALVDLSTGADVTGAYNAWSDQLDCAAVFVRPDFYVQGSARDVAELNHLVDDWRNRIGSK